MGSIRSTIKAALVNENLQSNIAVSALPHVASGNLKRKRKGEREMKKKKWRRRNGKDNLEKQYGRKPGAPGRRFFLRFTKIKSQLKGHHPMCSFSLWYCFGMWSNQMQPVAPHRGCTVNSRCKAKHIDALRVQHELNGNFRDHCNRRALLVALTRGPDAIGYKMLQVITYNDSQMIPSSLPLLPSQRHWAATSLDRHILQFWGGDITSRHW